MVSNYIDIYRQDKKIPKQFSFLGYHLLVLHLPRSTTMPRKSKRARHCQKISRENWQSLKSPLSEDSGADSDGFERLYDSTFWVEEEEEILEDLEFDRQLSQLTPASLEQLIENAKKSEVQASDSKERPWVYRGNAPSSLRGKRAMWRKAADGCGKVTDWLAPTASRDTLLPVELEDAGNVSDNNEEYTLEMLDSLLEKSKHVDIRLHTVSQFLHLVQDQGYTKQYASQLLSTSLKKGLYHARLIRSWANQWLTAGELAESRRGKYTRVKSLIEDEDTKAQITRYLRMNKLTVDLKQFIQFVKNEVIPWAGISGQKTISEKTARAWLHEVGWEYKKRTKGIYFDGHERDDVVEYRHKFVSTMAELRSLTATYDGDNLDQVVRPTLPPHTPEHVIVTQDESIFYANDDTKKVWGPSNECQLRRRSQGLSIHVSEFLCETVGRLRLSEEECEANDLLPDDQRLTHTEACVTIHPGENRDGWWTNKDIIQQVIERAIPIFERIHPGKIAVFLFDNSSNHCAFAQDALLCSRMNLYSGGKQPLLRHGEMPGGLPHIMTFVDENGVIQAKGMKRILSERGLWIDGMKKICALCTANNPDPMDTTCCATRVLSAQPDFMSQKCRLQEVIEAAGHKCLFYPKFHCELNFIESFWADVKRYRWVRLIFEVYHKNEVSRWSHFPAD